MAKKTLLEQQIEDKKENELLKKFGRKKKSLQERKRRALVKQTRKFSKAAKKRYPLKPVNKGFKKTGNIKQDITVSSNINLKKMAELASKRRQLDKVKGKGIPPSEKEVKKRLSKKRARRKDDKEKGLTTNKLQTKSGEYVLMDGTDYEGYFHLQKDGTAMSEPVLREGISQPLVLKSDYLENLYVYKTIVKRLEYKNPYVKKVEIKVMDERGKTDRIKVKRSTAGKGIGSLASGRSIGGRTSGGGSGGSGY